MFQLDTEYQAFVFQDLIGKIHLSLWSIMGDLVFSLLKSLEIHLYNFHYSVNTFQALNRLWKKKKKEEYFYQSSMPSNALCFLVIT